MLYYRSRAFADSTKKSYLTHLRTFMQFCEQTGSSPVLLDNKVLCRYAAHLASKLSYVSIPKYLNILRIMQRELGMPNPLHDNWMLDTVLKGIKRDKGAQTRRKLPITPSILLGIKSRLDLQQPKDLVFWAVCMVAFFGLFRKSNLLPVSGAKFDPKKHLTRGDIAKCQSGLTVHVKWSKTIQFLERMFYVPLPFLKGHPLCPVGAVLQLLSLSGDLNPSAPLFSFHTPQGVNILTQARFTKQLQDIIQCMGLPKEHYSGHSFRRGGASWAFQAGVPGEMIQVLGDWRSDAYKIYLELKIETKFQFMNVFAKHLPVR